MHAGDVWLLGCHYPKLSSGTFSAYQIGASLLRELLASDGLNARNLVLIWASSEDLLAFLLESPADSWKGEHYVAAGSVSDFMAALKSTPPLLRLDSKIFLMVADNGLTITHEVYGKSARATMVTLSKFEPNPE